MFFVSVRDSDTPLTAETETRNLRQSSNDAITGSIHCMICIHINVYSNHDDPVWLVNHAALEQLAASTIRIRTRMATTATSRS